MESQLSDLNAKTAVITHLQQSPLSKRRTLLTTPPCFILYKEENTTLKILKRETKTRD